MKTQNFAQLLIVLALASACQSKKTTLNKSPAEDPNQGSAVVGQTSLEKVAPKVIALEIAHQTEQKQIIRATIELLTAGASQKDFKGYKVTLAGNTPAESFAKDITNQDEDLSFFNAIDAIFEQKTELKESAVPQNKAYSAMNVKLTNGRLQYNAILIKGPKTDDLIADILYYVDQSRLNGETSSVSEIAKTELKYKKISFDVAGMESLQFAIETPTQEYPECKSLLIMESFKGQPSNELYCLKNEDLASKAADDLMTGVLELKDNPPAANEQQASLVTVTLNPSSGDPAVVVKNPGKGDENVTKAFKVIAEYIAKRKVDASSDMKFGSTSGDASKIDASKSDAAPVDSTSPNVQLKPESQAKTDSPQAEANKISFDCRNIKLAGVWESKLVIQGEVVDLKANWSFRSEANQITSLDEALEIRSKAGVQNTEAKLRYNQSSCILERTLVKSAQGKKVDGKAKYYQMVKATGVSTQYIKFMECVDASCKEWRGRKIYNTEGYVYKKI